MIFLFLLIITYFLINRTKWTKQQIAEDYGICRKTLGKWVRHCSLEIDYEKWKRMRKLNILDVIIIFDEFGFPDEYQSLTKGEIVAKCETYYHTVKENVILNIEKLGLSKKAYLSLDIFPPRLSREIIRIIGA